MLLTFYLGLSCYELMKLVNSRCPVPARLGLKVNLRNYWEQQGLNFVLKFLRNVTLCLKFLTKFVALNLKVWRVSYVPRIPIYLESGTEF